jgi:hypothetical protein
MGTGEYLFDSNGFAIRSKAYTTNYETMDWTISYEFFVDTCSFKLTPARGGLDAPLYTWAFWS